jgi:hypothetical protein
MKSFPRELWLEARPEVDLADTRGLKAPCGLQLAQTDLDGKAAVLAIWL